MENYLEIFKSTFKEIIERYHFEVVPINEHEVALVGKGFAISVSVSREGATVYYIMVNEQQELIEYWFDNYICSKFDTKDRENYGKPANYNERIISELKVTASGLLNHWDNVLKGDQGWIEEYKTYEYGGEPKKANSFDVSILKPIFDKQKIDAN